MIQIKDIEKQYKTKENLTAKALDKVTLDFPDCGMVFILGKSGSGKSTLLNIIGGLDKASSGEIIINGYNSKDFTTKDFDSYRNAYIGFIFQEYNVLDEFTVGENITLALELQNKKYDSDVLSKLLEDIDMAGFASRKMNTLSGGQKQRVAIARALIKEPEVILADEPTGNLDSVTGKQIFDILKHLSKTKLVIVVSHDREFAEEYADRIIELKDGKIIFDSDSQKPNEIHYEKGISKSFIRSHLPFSSIVKIGLSIYKTKPVRFAFTVLLSVITFILFGIASTFMLFNGKQVAVNSFMNSNESSIVTQKVYYRDAKTYKNNKLINEKTEKVKTAYSYKEFLFIKEKYPDTLATIDIRMHIPILQKNTGSEFADFYDNGNFTGMVISDPTLEIVSGRLPEALDEIAISDFILEMFCYNGISLTIDNKILTFNRAEDIIFTEENQILLPLQTTMDSGIYASGMVKIVGVFKGADIPKDLADFKKACLNGDSFSATDAYYWKNNVLPNGLFSYIAVTKELVDYFKLSDGRLNIDENEYFFNASKDLTLLYPKNDFGYTAFAMNSYAKYGESCDSKNGFALNKFQLYDFNGNKLTTLPENSVAGDYRKIAEFYYNSALDYSKKINIKIPDAVRDLYRLGAEEIPATEAFEVFRKAFDVFNNIGFDYTEFQAGNLSPGSSDGVHLGLKIGIGGIFFERSNGGYVSDGLYNSLFKPMNDITEYSTKYKRLENAFINKIFISYADKSRVKTNEILNMVEVRNTDDSSTEILNPIFNQINNAVKTAKSLGSIFTFTGLGLALFAFFMMFNFISTSITAKKKDIGMLRAIGASSLDVFKIFICQAIFLAIVCATISVLGGYIACFFINRAVLSNTLLNVTLFIFGPLSVLSVFVIAFITAILATVIPTAIYCRKSPIDSIRTI